MALAKPGAAAKAAFWPRLGLTYSLMLRVIAVAVACFLVSAALALLGTAQEVRKVNAHLADIIARELQMQLLRIDSNTGLREAFPDWDLVAQRSQSAGQCVKFLRPDESIERSSCMGFDRGGNLPPVWFSTLVIRLVAEDVDALRPITYNEKAYGTLIVTTERAAVASAIWKDISGLIALTAMFAIATCLLQAFAIGRALRPTKDILSGLDRLSQGDLSCRLPDFRMRELQRISEVFNGLAAGLDRTLNERAALAARLVDGQEQERQRLARDLHDELAQNLSAISLRAASIKATATSISPALLQEADQLAKMTIATMKSLRTVLQTLRPPEIDDLGLAMSLEALVRERERLAGGALKISLDLDGGIDGLSPTVASHIYRIVQEALTNIVRHARAREALVSLRLPQGIASAPRHLLLRISDNGSGGDAMAPQQIGGYGLVGMRERVMALGGQLNIAASGEGGFLLEAMIPIPESEDRAA